GHSNAKLRRSLPRGRATCCTSLAAAGYSVSHPCRRRVAVLRVSTRGTRAAWSSCMRALVPTLLAVGVTACATDEAPAPSLPQPIDQIWAEAIRPGDMIVLVPGTGSYDYLAVTIEAMAGDHPLVDVRAHQKIADDAVVFEQAIAAAHRAGISNAQLEAGAL